MLDEMPQVELPVHWIECPAAADLTGLAQRTLRKAAERWSRMHNPPIRVQKKGDSSRAHWLFVESDCRTFSAREGSEEPVGVMVESQDVVDKVKLVEDYWNTRFSSR